MSETGILKPGHINGETGTWEMVIGLEIHACISKPITISHVPVLSLIHI